MSRRIAEVVQRSLSGFANESGIRVLNELIENHHSRTECFSPGENVQLLPRGMVLALNEFMDHVDDFAPVSAKVVAKVDDQALRLFHINLLNRRLDECNKPRAVDLIELNVVGLLFGNRVGDIRATLIHVWRPGVVNGTKRLCGKSFVSTCPVGRGIDWHPEHLAAKLPFKARRRSMIVRTIGDPREQSAIDLLSTAQAYAQAQGSVCVGKSKALHHSRIH